jgi:hypothetical protein
VELIFDFGFVDALLEFSYLEVEFLGLLGDLLHLYLEAAFQLLDQNFVRALVVLELHELGALAQLVLDVGGEIVVGQLGAKFLDQALCPCDQLLLVVLDVFLVAVHVRLVLQLVAQLGRLLLELVRDSLFKLHNA